MSLSVVGQPSCDHFFQQLNSYSVLAALSQQLCPVRRTSPDSRHVTVYLHIPARPTSPCLRKTRPAVPSIHPFYLVQLSTCMIVCICVPCFVAVLLVCAMRSGAVFVPCVMALMFSGDIPTVSLWYLASSIRVASTPRGLSVP